MDPKTEALGGYFGDSSGNLEKRNCADPSHSFTSSRDQKLKLSEDIFRPFWRRVFGRTPGVDF